MENLGLNYITLPQKHHKQFCLRWVSFTLLGTNGSMGHCFSCAPMVGSMAPHRRISHFTAQWCRVWVFGGRPWFHPGRLHGDSPGLRTLLSAAAVSGLPPAPRQALRYTRHKDCLAGYACQSPILPCVLSLLTPLPKLIGRELCTVRASFRCD